MTPRILRLIFGSAGFRDIRTRSILTVPPKGAFLAKLDSFLGNLSFGAQYYLSAIKT